MRKITIVSIAISTFFCAALLTQSCRKDNVNSNFNGSGSGGNTCGAVNISANNSSKSHNMGQNCMNCHTSGGQGKGCFQTAGTVYDTKGTTTMSNGVITLYTGVNASGTLRGTIYVDAKGNFHTTESIDFSGGLYPTITGASGDIQHMPDPTTTGACNSCHGAKEKPVWVK